MSVEINPTERCRLCRAGGSTSFNWPWANKHSRPNLYVYELAEKLKTGSLFKCKSCNNPWYLDGNELFMNSVPKTHLKLIEQWNASPITLPAEQLQILKNWKRVSRYQ